VQTTSDLAAVITPHVLRMLNDHPEHGIQTLKLTYRHGLISLIGIESSFSIMPDTGLPFTEYDA
jgi:hypothetical protein